MAAQRLEVGPCIAGAAFWDQRGDDHGWRAGGTDGIAIGCCAGNGRVADLAAGTGLVDDLDVGAQFAFQNGLNQPGGGVNRSAGGEGDDEFDGFALLGKIFAVGSGTGGTGAAAGDCGQQ